MASKTAAEVLREAAALVSKGWTQHVYAEHIDRDGDRYEVYPGDEEYGVPVCYCATGALGMAAVDDVNDYDNFGEVLEEDFVSTAIDALAELIAPGYTDARFVVEGWNDAPDRTADEVAAAMLKAADLLDPRPSNLVDAVMTAVVSEGRVDAETLERAAGVVRGES